MNPLVVAITVHRVEGGPFPDVGVTAELLRKVPFATDLIAVRAKLQKTPGWHDDFDDGDLTDEALTADRVARPRSAARQRERERKLALVAEAYADAYAANPGGGARALYRSVSTRLATAGVVRRDGAAYSPRTLAENVSDARRLHLLTPTIRGRAGGVLTPKGYSSLGRPLDQDEVGRWLQRQEPKTLGQPVRDQSVVRKVILRASTAKRLSDRQPPS